MRKGLEFGVTVLSSAGYCKHDSRLGIWHQFPVRMLHAPSFSAAHTPVLSTHFSSRWKKPHPPLPPLAGSKRLHGHRKTHKLLELGRVRELHEPLSFPRSLGRVEDAPKVT